MRSDRRLRYAELIVLGLLVAAIVGVLAPVVLNQREMDNRARCAKNLKAIGQAILLYSNENRNALPRTRFERGVPPTWGTPYAADAKPGAYSQLAVADADPFVDGTAASAAALAVRPAANDVTAAMFLILRTQDGVPEVFVCPSSRQTRFDYGGKSHGPLNWTNWPGRRGVAEHLSYSYHDPYISPEALSTSRADGRAKYRGALSGEFAIMADMNPGDGGNSRNHGRAGQNVLYVDGHVEFATNALVGTDGDDIFKPFDVNADGPVDSSDSYLLPTAADLEKAK